MLEDHSDDHSSLNGRQLMKKTREMKKTKKQRKKINARQTLFCHTILLMTSSASLDVLPSSMISPVYFDITPPSDVQRQLTVLLL
jgi:hypothetical protein